MRRMIDQALEWRWAPLISYLLLAIMLAFTFYVQNAHYRESCLRGAAERQALYDLLTLRPIPPDTPPAVRAKVEYAQRIFSQPSNCGGML